MNPADVDPRASDSPASPQEVGRHGSLRVLLVDDERESRAVLTAMLSVLDASVVSVPGAREALEALGKQRFDVLISDIGLTGRSGYELLQAVRALDTPESSLPAIAVTGHVTPEDRRRARDAGFDAHVAKPVDMQVLFAILRELRPAPRQIGPHLVRPPDAPRSDNAERCG